MDTLLSILTILWYIILGTAVVLALVYVLCLGFVKFFEFIKGEPGDGYKR